MRTLDYISIAIGNIKALRPVISSPRTQTLSLLLLTARLHDLHSLRTQIRGQPTDRTARLILPDTDIEAAGVQYQLEFVRNRVDGHAGDFAWRVGEVSRDVLWVIWLVIKKVTELDGISKQHQAHITFSGDEIPDEESAIVMANHRSWTDFYMIHSVAIRKKMLSNCKRWGMLYTVESH
ncbi:hypothetical protein BC937DRAFT_94746 [Endogone sp. FLAS-F59071]|nr:hypothetical protein BC937DRAFT_94746 [Endogone sp. FLAS-F59071]|eukprot:RUS13808.1 hypothetical protein BC937DRAFT_94746 [Endogone sp. FLAS-F59071]